MYFSNKRKLRILSFALVLTLAATLFVGCNPKPADPTDESTGSYVGPNLSDPTTATSVPETTEPAPTEKVNENTGTVTAQLTIRSHPNRDSEIVGNLYAGDHVEILQRQEVSGYTWGYISEPEDGWIVMDYVEMDLPNGNEPTGGETDPDPTTPTENNGSDLNLKGVITVTGKGLNIRSEPVNGKIVGGYDNGEVVTILETSNGWGRTDKGWINMDYVNTSGTSNNTSNNNNTNNNNTTNNNTTTNTNGNGSTTVIAKGIVTASQLNIRESANTDSDKVGSLNYGARVEILEKSGSWGRTKDGWIHLDYVYQDGTTTKNAVGATITGEGLNIRSGPGTGYDRVGSYSSGTRVTVLAQFKYGDVTWGCTDKGWISLEYVRLDGTDTGDSQDAIVTGDELNIRSGPGTTYNKVGKLDKGDRIEILYTVTVGGTEWGNIEDGWICMDYVDIID